jgi:hypothetical protein
VSSTDVTFKHEWRLEEDTGFIYAVTNGKIDEADALEFVRLFERDIPPGTAGFMLGDNRNATALTADARRVFAKHWNPGEMYIASFGQSFTYRMILNLLLKVLPLVRPNFTAALFADEAEARAWLTERRRAYFARQSSAHTAST